MLVVERLIEQVGVVPGHRFDRRDAEVVGHQVDEVHRRLDLGHLGMLEERRRRAGGEGEQQAPVARRAVGVEGGAQLRHQRGEVPLVLGPMDVAVAAQPRILPVDVKAVEVVAANEIDRAGHEHAPAVGRQRGVGEAARPRPAAHRDQHLQVRMGAPHAGQDLEVLGIAVEPFHDTPVADVGEGVVDVGQLIGGQAGRIDQRVPGEEIADDRQARRRRRHLRRLGLGPGSVSRCGGQGGRGDERREQAQHECTSAHVDRGHRTTISVNG